MDKNQKLKYLRAFIVLAAGLVMMICDFVTGQDLTTFLIHLLVVLICFYIFAEIAVWVISKALEEPTKEALDAEREALEQIDDQEAGDETESEQEEV